MRQVAKLNSSMLMIQLGLVKLFIFQINKDIVSSTTTNERYTMALSLLSVRSNRNVIKHRVLPNMPTTRITKGKKDMHLFASAILLAKS